MSNAKTPDMPTFSTSAAMSLIWSKAADNLHTHELEWFADGAASHIEQVSISLSEVLMSLGGINDSDLSDSRGTQQLLFNLSNQVDTITGLAGIAFDASYRARQALKGVTS